MKPLPSNLPPLPKDHEYLGRGGEFKVDHPFEGCGCGDLYEAEWIVGGVWGGHTRTVHYCAHKDSEIVKLNQTMATKDKWKQAVADGKTDLGFSEWEKTQTASFTPGPWVLSTVRGSDGLMVGAGDGSDVVADIRVDRPDYAANARLIAAAPKLFDYVRNEAGHGVPEAEELINEIIGGK